MVFSINKSVDYKDVVVRAVKTFVQAYVAAVVIFDAPWTKEAQGAAVAAGVSALWNFVKETL